MATVAVAGVLIALAAATGGLASEEPPIGRLQPLRVMTAKAHAVVLVKTGGVKDPGDGGARVYTIDVRRTITGAATAKKIRLVDSPIDFRDGRRTEPYLHKGDTAVVFLARRRTGAAGPYTPVDGRDGVVVLADHGDLAPIEAAIGNAEQLGAEATPGNTLARLEHVRIELASGEPRLILDAIAEFEQLDTLSAFALHESKLIERIVRDHHLDPGLRAGLIEVFVRKRAKPLLPTLERLRPDDAGVFVVALYARAALGRPADTHELQGYLRSSDPDVRIASVRGLTLTGDPDAVDLIGQVSIKDDSDSVRLTAIASLAATRSQTALPWLTRSFASDQKELRHAAAAAVLDIGGRAADRALREAALNGPSLQSRTFAAAVLVSHLGPGDPEVAELRNMTRDAQVRSILAPPRH